MENLLAHNINKRPLLALSAETIEQVKSFYCKDDILRHAPGKRDVVTAEDEKIQKRHLMMTLLVAYQSVKTDYRDIKIGKAKFCKLYPKYVML